MNKIHKAVIPAAGMGTRFLPATKAIPKEMLPIVDKPTIQYVVEEAVASGLQDFCFVTSQGKSAILDHFDYDYQFSTVLKEQGKADLLEMVASLSNMITISSVRQKKPLGLGHAVLVARPYVGQEPFGVFLGDDIIHSRKPGMQQLIEVFEAKQASVLAVFEVEREAVSRYGIPAVEAVEGNDRLFRITDLVEKPPVDEAPSTLAIIGRYVLTPAIFDALESTPPGKGGEIQLTDGLRALLRKEPVYAYKFEGTRYDAGNKLEYLQASIDFALEREDLADDLRRWLRSLAL
ncbi:MAG TPA: UTP--glucose-1-phosphate uridylyltransferase GalU [Acidobacteriota bacterium]|nr:UTP--glucose-1-phosphate uridylyltransferase GalU [Acidobacteriota bacterium]